MISKMRRPDERGARLAIVFNGSPLFTGAAGSGESEIRRWIIESDMLEAVVALPDQLFYNTGISTYFWVVTNRKAPRRRGKVQLIDARGQLHQDAQGPRARSARRSPPSRPPTSPASTEPSRRGPGSRSSPNESFGFLRITVERPLQLRWEITNDTLAAVEADKKVANLDDPQRHALLEALRNRRGSQHATEKSAKSAVQGALASTDADTPATLVKAVTDALAVRDSEAPSSPTAQATPNPTPTSR